MTMGENKSSKKQGDTIKKTTTAKRQVTGKINMDSGDKNLEEMLVNYTWYLFTELQDQKWVEFEQEKMPTRDPYLVKFSAKFQNQAPWDKKELKDTSGEGKVMKAKTKAFEK